MDDRDNKPPDEEEAALWQAMTRDVKPLPGKKHKQTIENKGKSEKHGGGGETVIPKKAPPRKAARGRELDRRTEERLRKGQMEIEATLDLHGMIQDKAEKALQGFILRAYGQGKRCVLVITGKGKTKAKDEDWLAPKPGVLKRMVPDWLARPPLGDIVLKTYPARPHHGGDGALYVFLRRDRA